MQRSLISLGCRCDVAFQLRMHGEENISHFFDWLVTSVQGVIKIIESDFDVFYPDHLVWKTDQSPSYVKDQETGTIFYHQFPMFAGNVPHNFLLYYDSFIKKFEYLANRFKVYMESRPVTLVRQEINFEDAIALEEVFLKKFPNSDLEFLYILNEDKVFSTPKGRSFFLKNNGSSLGDPEEWTRVLYENNLIDQPYRHSTVEILGEGHGDHNLDADNRFSKKQLLKAIDFNPFKEGFYEELLKLILNENDLERAKKISSLAKSREVSSPILSAASILVDYRLNIISHDLAADMFYLLLKNSNLPVYYLIEASWIFLQDRRFDDALAIINKALKSDPINQRVYFQKARVLNEMNDFNGLCKTLMVAKTLGPMQPVFHHMYAKSLAFKGDFSSALLEEEEALRMEPGFMFSENHLSYLRDQIELLKKDSR